MNERAKVRLAKFEAVYRSAVSKLAEEVRRKVVVPACRKYGFTFEVFTGYHTFAKDGLSHSESDSAAQDSRLRSAHVILNVRLIDGTLFGSAIRDVTEKDLAVARSKVTPEQRAARRSASAAKRAVRKAAKRAAKKVATPQVSQ